MKKGLEAFGIRKSFNQTEILKGVDLKAAPGDVVSIIGPSGSGKSTFLRCLNLLEQPTAGRIMLDGEELLLEKDKHTGDLKEKDTRQLQRMRAKMTMVFQNFNLWPHMTILENVTEAPIHVLKLKKEEAIERARFYLDKVGMSGRDHDYSAQLSGGQKQRVAIARALAMEPSVLLLDEPTSALDPELVSGVLNIVRDLAKENRAMIIVTHEMAFAKDVSSHVAFFDHGQIVEQGEPKQVFEQTSSDRLKRFLSSES